MMDSIKALIDSGMFSLLDIVLLGAIGVLLYLISIKQRHNETTVHDAIDSMQTLLEEERAQTQALSKTVFAIRQQVELEREKTYELREEILTLKNENMRLQNLVTQMDTLIQQYKEEIERLKLERDERK